MEMPDQMLATLEAKGFEVFVQSNSLIVSLRNRKVSRSEVAMAAGVEMEDLSLQDGCVRIDFW